MRRVYVTMFIIGILIGYVIGRIVTDHRWLEALDEGDGGADVEN